MSSTAKYEFRPDDGHVCQYLNGKCTWCGTPLEEPVLPLPADVALMEMPEPDPAAGPVEVDAAALGLMTFAIKPLTDSEIIELVAEAERVKEWAIDLVIEDADGAKRATDDLGIIAGIKVRMTEKKTEWTKGLDDALKGLRGDFGTIMAPVLEADKIARGKVVDWNSKVEVARVKAEDATRLAQESAEAAAEAVAGGAEAPDISAIQPVDVPAPAGPIRGASGSTSGMKANWTWEVEDFAKVPDAYKVIDRSQLTAIAKSSHDSKKIDGIRFFNAPSLTVRR